MKPVIGIIIDEKNEMTYGLWHGYPTEDNMVYIIRCNYTYITENYKILPKSRIVIVGYIRLEEKLPDEALLIDKWNPAIPPKYFPELTTNELENIQKAAYDMFNNQSVFYKYDDIY